MKCRANRQQQEEQFIFDIFEQTIATIFVVLERQGMSIEELKKLKDDIEVEFKFMRDGLLGREYNALDAVKYLNSKGIDFKQSIFKQED